MAIHLTGDVRITGTAEIDGAEVSVPVSLEDLDQHLDNQAILLDILGTRIRVALTRARAMLAAQ